MNFIVPEWPAPSRVGALSTMRAGGVSLPPYDDGNGGGGLNLGSHVGDKLSAVRENRRRLCGLLPAEPAWLSQVHGSSVIDAAAVGAEGLEADAVVATARGAVCAIQTADCLPVLFCDSAASVVGAAHAGWRGLAAGVLEATVRRMRDEGAQDIVAWLGPAIGPRAFEVGSDVVLAFTEHDPATRGAFVPIPGHQAKFLADIYALARLRLWAAGIQSIFGGTWCTLSEPDRFYSYRRDKVTGRMASLIWLK